MTRLTVVPIIQTPEVEAHIARLDYLLAVRRARSELARSLDAAGLPSDPASLDRFLANPEVSP